MKAEELDYSQSSKRPNHHSDALPSFPVEIRRRKELRRIEEARTTKHNSSEGWEDSAVPPEKLGSYLRDLRKLFDQYGYACALYGHFGQGCVHTRIDFDLLSKEGIEHYRSFIHAAADRSSASTGTASRAASCCPGCLDPR